ncbi:hypothetical protein N9955_00485 [bacterium]|nr:hypothetical protein [bacterium]
MHKIIFTIVTVFLSIFISLPLALFLGVMGFFSSLFFYWRGICIELRALWSKQPIQTDVSIEEEEDIWQRNARAMKERAANKQK